MEDRSRFGVWSIALLRFQLITHFDNEFKTHDRGCRSLTIRTGSERVVDEEKLIDVIVDLVLENEY